MVFVPAVTLMVLCGSLDAALAWTFTVPVAYSNVTSTSAVITWTTDVPAPTQVKYGVKVNGIPILQMLNQQTSSPGLTITHSITITGLLPGTIYYAAVVKEDGSVSFPVQFTTSNSTALLTVDFLGTGSGAVYSSPDDGIICLKDDGSSDCSQSYYTGTIVTLMPVVSNSTFTGWSGACTNVVGNCTVTMNAAESVTASFTGNPPTVIIEGDTTLTPYYSIDTALAASAGRTVKARDIIFTEPEVLMSSADSILFKGGYNAGFTDQTGYTVIDGSLKISNGTLIVERLEIR